MCDIKYKYIFLYMGVGCVFYFFTHVRENHSHIDEWKHSSIDFNEDSEVGLLWFRKLMNKMFSLILQTTIFAFFWPIFILMSIIYNKK